MLKIAHIIPGSGGSFYCGNCLRDSKFFTSMRQQGQDVIKVPMYLPLFSDESDLDQVPVFYGAVTIYLKQLFPIFRKAPAWVDSLLNTPALLKLAASQAGSTRAKGLEEMTISMLKGEQGQQAEELEKMTTWLKQHFQPDVIHLSNALLLGLAGYMKQQLGVPVVCSLQDEDVWVDVMGVQSREKVWNLMAEKAKEVDRFVAVSDYYAEFAASRMQIPSGKLRSLYIGVDPEDYTYRNAADKPRNIGFLSRMCRENGLDILTDAFILLKKQPEFQDVQLILTGGKTKDDEAYLHKIRKELHRQGLTDQVVFHPDFEGPGRQEFFDKVALMSVPVRNGEAFGTYMAESMAAGIPMIQPALGAFPEVIRVTGGGIVYGENTPLQLASTLAEVLRDTEKLKKLSQQTREGALKHLDIRILASKMISLYQELR